jgi:hypothetical protein
MRGKEIMRTRGLDSHSAYDIVVMVAFFGEMRITAKWWTKWGMPFVTGLKHVKNPLAYEHRLRWTVTAAGEVNLVLARINTFLGWICTYWIDFVFLGCPPIFCSIIQLDRSWPATSMQWGADLLQLTPFFVSWKVFGNDLLMGLIYVCHVGRS